ncbi:hypothetical protein Q7C36_001953 [Tachysurus vachellii]|uniref:SEA domain-containing protein n=1 Tax=Tachysurus vachellii TaxID=175792 RepID=A0AA88NRZ5_TACVA|nr:hypothetical protein Q7C36_001953 [Tachysurus vachellii]
MTVYFGENWTDLVTSTVLRTFHICFLKTPEVINNTMDWKLVLTVLCLTALADKNSPEFAQKSGSICNQLEAYYGAIFTNFIKANILGFSNGSIVTNSSLEFSANGTIPTDATIKSILVNATTNSSLNIIPDSISVEPLYKKAFNNFILMQILNFRSGSTITESKLYMDSSGPDVTVTQVKDVFLNGLKNFNFSVNPGSIMVKQIGNSVPPVIASSVSMIWMSLLTLLLSLALHI